MGRTTTSDKAWIGDVLSGLQHWDYNNNSLNYCGTPPVNYHGWPLPNSTDDTYHHHYLPDIENEFLKQANNFDFSNAFNKYSLFQYTKADWGTTNFNKGFHYFQYGLNDLTITATKHDALLDATQVVLVGRKKDTEHSIIGYSHWACDSELKLANNTPSKNTDILINSELSALIYPNPINENAIIILEDKSEIKYFGWQIKDITGRDISEQFSIKKGSDQNELILTAKQNLSG